MAVQQTGFSIHRDCAQLIDDDVETYTTDEME